MNKEDAFSHFLQTEGGKIIADLYRNNDYGEVLALCKAIFNTGYEQGKIAGELSLYGE